MTRKIKLIDIAQALSVSTGTVHRALHSHSGVSAATKLRVQEMAKALGINLGELHQSLNEIQNVGIDWGSRTLSAGPTLKLQSTDPEFLPDNGDNPFDLCYRREQHEILDHALSCDLNHRLSTFEPSFGRALFISPLDR